MIMVIWSNLIRPATQLVKSNQGYNKLAINNVSGKIICLRQMSGNNGHSTMVIRPSNFQWRKFKDFLHFYVMLGLIPVVAVITYANVFIGPAQLEPIPEGYEPKYWEYYKHPISRFIARYLHNNPQQDYEKAMHHFYEEEEKSKLRLLENRIQKLISERNDYQAYYYRPIMAKYHRISKEASDELESLRGDF